MEKIILSAFGGDKEQFLASEACATLLSNADCLGDLEIHGLLYKLYDKRIMLPAFEGVVEAEIKRFLSGSTDGSFLVKWLENIPHIRTRIYASIVSAITTDIENDEIEAALGHLKFLARVAEYNIPMDSETLNLAWTLLNSPNSGLASTAEKLISFGLAAEALETADEQLWWDGFDPDCPNSSLYYKAWLSWAIIGQASSTLSGLVKTQGYWERIRLGLQLGSQQYESTKFCLSILQHSLSHFEQSEIPSFLLRYRTTNADAIAAWRRYIALFEITTVNTSMNQTEDSTNDILSLLTDGSCIPHLWVLTFLRATMRSNMDTIKRYVANLVLNLPEASLALFDYDPVFLADSFLPFVLQAPLFVTEGGKSCPHADLVERFIRGLKFAMRTSSMMTAIDRTSLWFVENPYAFEPSKAIALFALAESPAPPISELALPNLVSLFDTTVRSHKSKVMAEVIHELAFNLITSSRKNLSLVDESTGIALLERLNSNGLLAIPDLEQLVRVIPDEWLETIKLRASERSLFRAIQILVDGLPTQPVKQNQGAADLVLYLDSRGHDIGPFKSALRETVLSERMSDGYISPSSRMALKVAGDIVREGDIGPDPLLGDLPLYNLQLMSSSSSIPSPDESHLIQLLGTRGSQVSQMTSMERNLHAQALECIFELLPGSPQFCAQALPLLASAVTFERPATRRAAMESMLRYIKKADAAIVSESNIGNVVGNTWEAFKEHTLRAGDRDAHISFIKVLTNPQVAAVSSASAVLERVVSEIAEQSFARRNLLVPLATGLSAIASPLPWIPRAMTKIFVSLHSNIHPYVLENIVAERAGIYSKSWGRHEIFARVMAIEYLSRTDRRTAEDVSRWLLQSKDINLLHPSNRHDGAEEQVRILAYQVLTLLAPKWSASFSSEISKSLFEAIDIEASPEARIYIEWTVALIASSNEAFVEDLILSPLRGSTQPRFVSSLGRISLLYGKANAGKSSSYFEDLVYILLPLATSNKAGIRHFAVSLIYAVHLDPSMRGTLSSGTLALVDGVAKVAAKTENFKEFRQGDDVVWDIHLEHTLVGICGGLTARVLGASGLELLRTDYFEDVFGKGTYGGSKSPRVERPLKTFHNATVIRDGIQPLSDNIQIKSAASEGSEIQRTDLIVVASLCDRPPNMGGICRLCDALGVKLLTFHDLSLTRNPQFRSTAVTADKWMPMKQVAESQIADFLREQKRNGYTLVGMEQTDNSQKLTSTTEFPTKTVLLMGKEREGIPGDLLRLMDFCLEIEQIGVVRSMNIQTATAVLVHAYNNQHK